MPNPVALSKRTWLGVAIETAPGTAAATPTVYVPTKSTMKGTKKRVVTDDERNNRDGTYGIIDTTRAGATDLKGNWYNDTSPYFLIAALGSVTSAQPDATTLPTIHKHTITLADIPVALTMFKGLDIATYTGAYAAVEKWSLKFNADGKVIENDVTLKHLYPVKHTGAAYTPTFSQQQAISGNIPTLTLGGVTTTDIDDLSIEFDQDVTEWYSIAGSPDYTTLYFGKRNVKVDFTARFDSDTVYNRFLNRQDDSLTIDIKGATLGTDAGVTYFDELSITVPIISYDSADHDTSKTNVLIKAKASGISGTSPLISAFVQNTVASYAV